MDLHERAFENLRRILTQVEKNARRIQNNERSIASSQITEIQRHDITVAVLAFGHFLEAIEKCSGVIAKAGAQEELPVFTMMNNMLFNQRKFREVISRIMGTFYGYMDSEASLNENSQIILLGHFVEVLALYIKSARQETMLLEDESFSNTIALMKINRIMQLKDFKLSEVASFQDFTIERVPDGTETNITNSLAAGDVTHKTQQIAAENLRHLRKIRSDMSKLRGVLQEFQLCFTRLLYTKSDFAGFWKQALASKNYGYAVESYAEKCTRELEASENSHDDISRVISKLSRAEGMLIETEHKISESLVKLLIDTTQLSDIVRATLPLIVAACVRATGSKYEALIGETNLLKYQEMKMQRKAEHASLTKSSLPSRKKLISTFAEKHGMPRVAKVADMLRLGGHEALRRGNLKQPRSSCSHQDIIDEYDFAFTQTMEMLQETEFSAG